MTVFNGEKFLRQAIDSVLVQTFDDWELIVVDDASNDSTPEILHSYHDPRIKRLREERNRKQAACSNRALSTATGKYIARLDADDVALPNWLAEKIGYMQAHPDVALLGNAAFDMNEEGVHTGVRPGGLGDFDLKLYLTACNPIIHCSIVFRTEVARELSGYNEDERYWFSEDYDFLSRIAFSGKAIVLPQPLVEVRVHSTSVSARNDEDQAHQGKCITRANLQRALGHDVDDRTWSAWWRFVRTEPGRAAQFDADEVKSLTALVSEMIRSVSRERVGRCKVPWLWAKHALALALLPKNHIAVTARARFVLMALIIGIETLVMHR